jgi:hypothetical protein
MARRGHGVAVWQWKSLEPRAFTLVGHASTLEAALAVIRIRLREQQQAGIKREYVNVELRVRVQPEPPKPTEASWN